MEPGTGEKIRGLPRGGAGAGVEERTTVRALEEAVYNNRIRMVRCRLFVLPCVNWMMPEWATDPLLSEEVVNSLSLAEAIVAMYQSVRSL